MAAMIEKNPPPNRRQEPPVKDPRRRPPPVKEPPAKKPPKKWQRGDQLGRWPTFTKETGLRTASWYFFYAMLSLQIALWQVNGGILHHR